MFFPLGAVLGWLGMLPWLLFGAGALHVWPGVYHALTMTQAFLAALAVGFLGTMLPRRTGTAPMSAPTLVGLAVALAAMPLAFATGHLAVGEGLYLAVLLVLGCFALSRLRASRPGGPPLPYSFVFLPTAIAAGLTGGGLLLFAARTAGAPGFFAAGRTLAEEGLLEALVLALAPLLTPAILDGHAVNVPAPSGAARLAWRSAAALFLSSFAVQHVLDQRAGLLLRGGLCAAILYGATGLLRRPRARGLHRRVYQVALALMPLGLLGAGLASSYRVPLLHVTFVGGFSLLVFAVSFHVGVLHTGRDALSYARPFPVAATAVLTLAAMVVRATAEWVPAHYFAALTAAAALWLAGAMVWGGTLTAYVLRPAGRQEAT